MKISGKVVCPPIDALVSLLKKNGFRVIDKGMRDYHFNEVFIKMKSPLPDKLPVINISNIQNIKSGVYACQCHWSTVYLDTVTDNECFNGGTAL
ncbi:hypothetical protein N5923_08795 [Erwiniaceae bacterium BAC15a-03b]|uniref:Uncharacterized protein n=1 Tax=Winslowiella arboricola TaxID=2978220 RepID=A0A9J6PS82_9GAMM|nr:hypothetical protein [Winslowiella arboricola]MCU5771741.1 hypothetical protein [Winslowiella arboricola]MCU5777588.1 hypothetical protein [Winslowiella arboricola]